MIFKNRFGMKHIKRFIGIAVLFCGIIGSAQERFPSSWEGDYEGELQIFGVDSIRMRANMKLNIHKKSDSIFQWKITYEMNGDADVRDYELHVKDVDKGHYVIDELNTILIDGYYRTGNFTSIFEVMNSLIVSEYTKVENGLLFEIVAGSNNSPIITGNQKHNGEDIPEVKSFAASGRQRALLIKK